MGQTVATRRIISSAVGGAVVGIEFVEVEAKRFPVFVQADGDVEVRLALEPVDVRASFLGFEVEVLAIQIEALRVLAAVGGEARGIQARTEPEVDVLRPGVLLNERAHGERPGGFVPVDPGGEIDAAARLAAG
jgi:hypothetical protein